MHTIITNHINSIVRRTERAQAAKARRDARIKAVREGAGVSVSSMTERAHAAQQVELEDELGRCGISLDEFFELDADERIEVLHNPVEIPTDPFVLGGEELTDDIMDGIHEEVLS